jgi:hypothetical protein
MAMANLSSTQSNLSAILYNARLSINISQPSSINDNSSNTNSKIIRRGWSDINTSRAISSRCIDLPKVSMRRRPACQ